MIFLIIFNLILGLIVLGVAGTILFWQYTKKRTVEKTYMYHLKIILNSGKIIHLTLDDELYNQFNALLIQETGKFQIVNQNKINPKLQDSSTTLYIQYIAAVSMRRW
jgi:hypothetical protein